MALVYVDTDPWLTEHEACEKLYREIMEQLTVRGGEQRTSQAYARLSSAIRLRMRQFSTEVQQLREKLAASTVTFEEAERRSRLVEQLQSREILLQRLFHDRSVSGAGERSELFQQGGQVFSDRATTGWGSEEDEVNSTKNMTIPELRQQQQQMVQDQDHGLDALLQIISRQKQIASTINNEVDLQNDILDDITEHVDSTDTRIVTRTKQVEVITHKDRTVVYWVVIILLFIAILIAALT